MEQKRQGNTVRGKGVRYVFCLDEFIDGAVMRRVMQDVIRLHATNPHKSIHLFLSASGGQLMPAVAFWEFVRIHRIMLDVTVLGAAHSAAIILLCAGRRRFASGSSRFFLHPVFRRYRDVEMTADDLREQTAFSRDDADKYERIVAAATSQSLGKVKMLMEKRTNLDVRGAKNIGLIHKVIPTL